MDIRKCLEILELDHCPTVDEAKQAYKDLVNVWHPDRFNENARLRKRAEKKLKEINLAYEIVENYLISKDHRKGFQKEDREEYGDRASGSGSKDCRDPFEDPAGGATEAVFEAGTFFVLNAWSRLSETVRRYVGEAQKTAGVKGPVQGATGRGKDGGTGRGSGMAGGGGMDGRKGRGRGRQR